MTITARPVPLEPPDRQRVAAVLVEAFASDEAMLSLVGAFMGLLLSAAGLLLMERLFPSFPLAAPLWAPLAAVGVALSAGLILGVMPARQAARLDPVTALSRR